MANCRRGIQISQLQLEKPEALCIVQLRVGQDLVELFSSVNKTPVLGWMLRPKDLGQNRVLPIRDFVVEGFFAVNQAFNRIPIVVEYKARGWE